MNPQSPAIQAKHTHFRTQPTNACASITYSNPPGLALHPASLSSSACAKYSAESDAAKPASARKGRQAYFRACSLGTTSSICVAEQTHQTCTSAACSLVRIEDACCSRTAEQRLQYRFDEASVAYVREAFDVARPRYYIFRHAS